MARRLFWRHYFYGSLAGSSRPLRPGEAIVLYLTGLGRKVQTFAEGAAPKISAAKVQYAGCSRSIRG